MPEFDLPHEAFLYADSARGVFIPQHFAESIRRECVKGVSYAQWRILETGPDAECYWDVWTEIENTARITDSNGQTFALYQDGDLWFVPVEWSPCDDSWLESN